MIRVGRRRPSFPASCIGLTLQIVLPLACFLVTVTDLSHFGPYMNLMYKIYIKGSEYTYFSCVEVLWSESHNNCPILWHDVSSSITVHIMVEMG